MMSKNRQASKNKMPAARQSAYLMALRKKNKRAGAHKPAIRQPHSKGRLV